MRTLTDHIVSGDQSVQLHILVLDEPGAGGANHQYQITDSGKGAANPLTLETGEAILGYVGFQNGPIKESGVNGITQEALLAITIDRLRSFQNGPYKCRENAIALTHCEEALSWGASQNLRMVFGIPMGAKTIGKILTSVVTVRN